MIMPQRRVGPLPAAAALAAASLLACGLLSGCGQSGPSAGAAGQTALPAGSGRPAQHAAGGFSQPLNVSNPMFPMVVGTEFQYQGTIVDGEGTHPHSVVFTVTDLWKQVDHVRTVVALDQDFRDGGLQEQELAFFAQDDAGNVWNFGEYPEEYENGKFTGAPSTWIRETGGAYGGIHMLSKPKVGAQYREGLVPAIQFDDISQVARTGQRTCVPAGCYRHVLVIDETSPNDPTSGHQIKYYSPHTGLVRVGARGGDSQEFLTLVAIRHLGRPAMAKIRVMALGMESRAYRISMVYRATGPAQSRQK
jgi:hypothetical protein